VACGVLLAGTRLAHADWAEELVAYWPFEGDFNDASPGGDHHGEAQGTEPILFESGRFGDAIRLNGEDQFVEITSGDEADFDFEGGDMSISAWFTVDAFDTSWQALIAKGESDRWRLHRRGDGNVMAFTGGNAGDTADAGPAVDDGEWHHVAAIAIAGENTRLYIDGALAAESTPSTLGNNDMNVMIGENPDARNREWEGFIDDVAIWGRALTDEEIGQIWSDGSGNSIGFLLNPVELPGDFNEDGVVDQTDFNIMASNFNAPADGYADGDFDFNGRVNLKDFVGFREVYGAQPAEVASIPEPAGFLLLSSGALLLMLRRRRRHA
jgi:hypothetical protein